jgi:hypothetical protein
MRSNPVGEAGQGGVAGAERPRRSLSLVDRLVCVPIGFLWLVVLAIAALPVMIYMTALYWSVQGISWLLGRKSAPPDRSDREERVA